ncbi:Rec8 like protein-domain-containing protein [Dipodascopsis uninucleata]
MFYSESLLSKKGPLARVWLAANLERKLSKAQFLQTNIEKSVSDIVGDNVAPMALRLSGQLLLGVVRIYSRKAKYLLEDCSDALSKLRVTFHAGSVDLATNAVVANPQQLTLPNTITELDLLFPDPLSILKPAQSTNIHTTPSSNLVAYTTAAKDITLPDLQDSIELARGQDIEDELANIGDDDLVLDTGEYLNPDDVEDMPMIDDEMPAPIDESIEIGRDNQVDANVVENYGMEPLPDESIADISMVDANKSIANNQDEGDLEMMDLPSMRPDDEPLTPLSSHLNVINAPSPNVPQKETPKPGRVGAARKIKIDTVTELKSTYIKDMQENRTGILSDKDSLLPQARDTVALLELWESNGIIDIVFKPSYMSEALASLLRPSLLRDDGSRKRKATKEVDEDVGDLLIKKQHVGQNQNAGEIVANDDELVPFADEDFQLVVEDETGVYDGTFEKVGGLGDYGEVLAAQNKSSELVDDDIATATGESTQATAINDISRNTKETVKRLQSELEKSDSIDFQSLTENSSRTNAVKLFFETLVLATKDVIEVEQKNPFGIIDIKAKESLYHDDWLLAGPQDATEIETN